MPRTLTSTTRRRPRTAIGSPSGKLQFERTNVRPVSAAAGLFRSGGFKPRQKKKHSPMRRSKSATSYMQPRRNIKKKSKRRGKSAKLPSKYLRNMHILTPEYSSFALGGRKGLKRMPRSISGPNLTVSEGSSTFKPGNTLPQRSASSVNIKPRFSLTNLHQTEQDRTLAHTVQVMEHVADEAGQHTRKWNY